MSTGMGSGFPALEAAAVVLLVASLFFTLAAAVGVLRLPDFYTRLHAIGKCDTVGLALAVLAFALLGGSLGTAVKLLLVSLFLAFAGPTAAHALGRAARRSGVAVWRRPTPPPEPAAGREAGDRGP